MQFDLNIPGVYDEMLFPDFWLQHLADRDKIIMTGSGIERYNRKAFAECEVLKDLRSFPAVIGGEQLRASIEKVSVRPQKKLYLNGEEISEEYYDALENLLNLDQIKKLTEVRFGISVKRTEMRAFPTYDRVFSESDDCENDMFIETALYPAEALAILHTSSDSKWLFAQAYNYLAWLPAADVAFTSREKLFSYLDTPNFLVVSGKDAFTGYNPQYPEISELQLDMGTRIPLDINDQNSAGNYVVKLPARGAAGQLEFRTGLIARSEHVRSGYLPLTRKNIITQAFKFLGQRYGWGGMFNTRDCSSFIMDIYRSMGVLLPRNSGEQGEMAVGIMHEFNGEMTLAERKAVFDKMSAGTPVYMAGHAMLYLGRLQGDYYVIHDIAGFFLPGAEGNLVLTKVCCVLVAPLLVTCLADGRNYLGVIYSAREFVLPENK